MAIITATVFLLLLILVVRAWKRRIMQQTKSFSEPLEALEFFGEFIAQAKAFYVATTFADSWLERIAAYGLGPRGNAQVFVFSEGLLIVRTGERPLAIDRASISSVSLGQVAIDKVVETDGLIQVNWFQDSVKLCTHLRIVDENSRIEILQAANTVLVKEETK
jgi:hypothetical protein